MDFLSLPVERPLTLKNLTAPACLADRAGDLTSIDLTILEGRIVEGSGQPVDMKGAMVLPAFIDMHTHLDKGHIWPRTPNPDGTFAGALHAASTDRSTRWSAEDVRTRMDFALRCAFAHGTQAVRTHIDSISPQDEISWPVFSDMRCAWEGRIALQGVCLVGIADVDDEGAFVRTADIVAEHGGVLGCVAYPLPDLLDRLRCFLRMAEERGLAVDFHADETLDPSAAALKAIAAVVLETGFSAPVTVGHCCSLAQQDAGAASETLDLVAEAGLNIVSLPLCNLYLQDRQSDRTPRQRGITLVHEMKSRGVPVSFASDNTRDPFYAYGDLDMVEVMREATRIGHLDHSDSDWVRSFQATPAAACGFPVPRLAPGTSADLVIFRARNWNELLARPQADRIVLRAGRQIDRTLPDYAELDHLMERR